MRSNKRVTQSSKVAKTVTRTTPSVRTATPVKRVVTAIAPAKSTRQPVKAHGVCRQSDKPCTKSQINFDGCNTNLQFQCIVYADNIDMNGELIPGRFLDTKFPTVQTIADCATTGCKNPDGSAGTISVTIVDTFLTVDNGVYTLSRIYKVTDSCGNTALFTFTITFTISDGEGPVIIIEPFIGPPGNLVACSEGSNPTPSCPVEVPGLPDECDCECVFLKICRPTDAEIDAALGEGFADGCDAAHPVVVHSEDRGPFMQGECYKYKIRVFTAEDECCNVSTKCRVVKWVDDVTNPTIDVSPTIDELLALAPTTYKECTDQPADTDTIDYQCIDLGCNPNIDINYALGTGTAQDNCSDVAQLCTKTSRRVGDCCRFSQTRTFTVEDFCANKAITVVRTVIWKEDTEGPVIQCASEKMLPCEISVEEAAQYFDTPDVFDTCDGCIDDALMTVGDDVRQPATGFFADGSYTLTRTWTAVDSCGIYAEHVSQTLIIPSCDEGDCDDDNGPPRLTCAADGELECDTVPTLADFHRPTAADVGGFSQPFGSLTIDPSVGDNSAIVVTNNVDGSTSYTVTFTVSGTGIYANETVSCTQTLTSPACGVPVLQCPARIVRPCSTQVPSLRDIEIAAAPVVFAIGFCSGASITAQFTGSPIIVATGTIYIVIITATDECGQKATCELEVFVPNCDNGEPAISCSAPGNWPCCNDAPTAADFYQLQSGDVSGFTQNFADLDIQYGVPEGQVYYDGDTYSITIVVKGTGVYKDEIAECVQELVVDACGPVSLVCAADSELPCGSPAPTANSFQTLIESDLIGFCDTLAEITLAGGVVYGPVTSVAVSGGVKYTRVVTVTDSKGNSAICTQNITVPTCPPVVQKGCTKGFYGNSTGQQVWNQSTDPQVATINANITVISPITGLPLPFGQNTRLLEYFGFTANQCGISTTLTLLDAINETGKSCNQLISHGVAALLNMAAFGSSYIISGTCTAVGGGPINTLQKLYDAIKFALQNCVCTSKGCDCGGLGACLGDANNHPGPYCDELLNPVVNGRTALRRGLKATPIKKAVAPKRAVQPVAKKVIARPVSKKVAVKPVAKKVVHKKTFVPGNAQ